EVRQKLFEEAQMAARLATPVEVPRVSQARDPNEDQRSLAAKVRREVVKVETELAPAYRALESKGEELGQERREALADPAYLETLARADVWNRRIDVVRTFMPLLAVILVLVAGLLVGRGLNLPGRRAVPSFA